MRSADPAVDSEELDSVGLTCKHLRSLGGSAGEGARRMRGRPRAAGVAVAARRPAVFSTSLAPPGTEAPASVLQQPGVANERGLPRAPARRRMPPKECPRPASTACECVSFRRRQAVGSRGGSSSSSRRSAGARRGSPRIRSRATTPRARRGRVRLRAVPVNRRVRERLFVHRGASRPERLELVRGQLAESTEGLPCRRTSRRRSARGRTAQVSRASASASRSWSWS